MKTECLKLSQQEAQSGNQLPDERAKGHNVRIEVNSEFETFIQIITEIPQIKKARGISSASPQRFNNRDSAKPWTNANTTPT